MGEQSGGNKPLRIALLGCGTVGLQVARLLIERAAELAAQIGRDFEIVGVAVRDLTKPRPGIPADWLTDDAAGLIIRSQPDIVVELIGGLEPAETLIRTAFANGAAVVTANKMLLGDQGQELFAQAQSAGVDLFFEAAVAGAIPIVRPLRESLVGERITEIVGVVNGTTNFIIEQMATKGMAFDAALAQAKQLGYAEEDASADVSGRDAAAKTALLASLGFHTWVNSGQVYREGITALTPEDFQAARTIGCVIKLLAVATLSADGAVSARVHPALVPADHTLATVSGAYNAIFLESEHAGKLAFFGPGAGGVPTATAVIGDIVTVGRNRIRGVTTRVQVSERALPVQGMGQVASHYFLRFQVADAPGILARVGEVFARHNISVRSLNQASDADATGRVQLTALTHLVLEADMQACLAELSHNDFVNGELRMLRVWGL
ncbi:MAG: homoserine dehydrogenase [Propionibacteriaceae bacterium]|nr:homoserine dehydrogenase [Propionibacteriaceae bacterium]